MQIYHKYFIILLMWTMLIRLSLDSWSHGERLTRKNK
jgi:hypothetical protein